VQLDRTFIAIRERDILEIFDLTLLVIRAFLWPLLLTFAAGVLPLMVLHHWWLGGFDLLVLDADVLLHEGGWRLGVFFQSVALVALLAPLAAAPTTLYLGQALFLQRPSPWRIAQEWFASLPQLILLQVVLRAVLFLPVVTVVLPFAVWPYLNEIILLERNPLTSRNRKRITTMQRSNALHGSSFGELFVRWVTSVGFAVVAATMLFLAMWLTKFWLTGNLDVSRLTYLIYWEVALWATACFFAVARFLSYLDLRIRREGWEVELKMRAEGLRLARQLV
jgi:hypothetical protein